MIIKGLIYYYNNGIVKEYMIQKRFTGKSYLSNRGQIRLNQFK